MLFQHASVQSCSEVDITRVVRQWRYCGRVRRERYDAGFLVSCTLALSAVESQQPGDWHTEYSALCKMGAYVAIVSIVTTSSVTAIGAQLYMID
ncbi:hypothetical protein BDW68DRAFT_172412 [Aspergillus falconensis]